MKQEKRWMACLLALVLCVSVFAPVTAFAEDRVPLFFTCGFGLRPGAGHSYPGGTGQIGTNLDDMWRELTITVTDEKGNQVTSPNYFVDTTGAQATNRSIRRFGGMWPVGAKLTVKIDTAKLENPYHVSYKTPKGSTNEGWIVEGGFRTFTILHQAAKGSFGQPLTIEFGQVSVEFNPQGGTIGGQTEKVTNLVKTDNSVEFPETPAKANLHFGGWYTQFPDASDVLSPDLLGTRKFWTNQDEYSDFGRDWSLYNDPAIDPLRDGVFRLRALWEAEVTFDTGNGGTAIAPVRVEEGKTLSAPKEPTKSGYIFQGWKTQDGNDFDFATPIKKDMTLTAKWDKKPSSGGSDITTDTTIYVDPNGGQFSDGSTAVKSYAVTVGERFTLPEAPIREGYKFLYWKGSKYQPGDQYTVEAGGHTFVAEWEKDEKKPEDKPTVPSVDSNIKTPRGSALTHEEIAKILVGMKSTVPAIPKAGVGR